MFPSICKLPLCVMTFTLILVFNLSMLCTLELLWILIPEDIKLSFKAADILESLFFKVITKGRPLRKKECQMIGNLIAKLYYKF